MKVERSLTCAICVLIAGAAWGAAFAQRWSASAVVSASVISALCAAITVLRVPARLRAPETARAVRHADRSAQFRRGLFDLCAALRLGIRFCEHHLDASPERLLEQLEQMSESINSFINQAARPVRLEGDSRWLQRLRPRWPWRASTGRTQQ